MIDIALIDRACEKSKVLEKIDCSWRAYVQMVKESAVTIPFQGEYNALVVNNNVLVEGYCGQLIIDKAFYNRKTYVLKKPVQCYPFKIYGAYNSRGEFENYVARPEIGFHYLGMTQYGHSICIGDIEYVRADSFESLKEMCAKIADSFRLINMNSLGTVLLPVEHDKLRNIFSNREETMEKKFERLLSEGIIEELL